MSCARQSNTRFEFNRPRPNSFAIKVRHTTRQCSSVQFQISRDSHKYKTSRTGCGTKTVLQLKLMYLKITWLNIIIRGMQSYYYQNLNMALDFSMLTPVYLYGQKNLVSVETHKAETQIKLDKGIKMGRVLGFFLRNQFLP